MSSRVKGASGRTAMGKPNQLGSELGVASGRMKTSSQPRQALLQQCEIAPARCNKAGQLLQLRHAHRGLHIGEFQVVADVRVGVLVIVAAGQLAELPVETLAAGVVLAGFAPAVAAPVAEGFDQRFQHAAFPSAPRRLRPSSYGARDRS